MAPLRVHLILYMPTDLTRLSAALADRYTIERELGQGGMATVYLAHDLKHDRQVALKILRRDLSHELSTDRFAREIKLAARLTHPHILPLFDSGEADGFLYYVMPVMEGESLRDRIDNTKQMAIDEVVQVAREVADALDYAHRHDTVHRDIKPENIMLHEGHAVIADFGIGKAVTAAAESQESITQTGVSVGTPAYMSPEQAAGEDSIDGRSDLFSLGCVLFEMLTGEPAFTGKTAAAVIAKRFAHTPPPVTQTREAIPINLSRAVSQLLERAPEDRLESGAALIELLTSGSHAATARPPALMKSVAVLPFANLSADPENEYFADGMTEELINALSQIDDLHVPSRTSCFYFKGKNPQLREVGRELKVSTVLTGGVRKAGTRVRITVQLVDVANDENLWSERYDRQLDDIFDLQDELARAIADQLQVTLGAGANQPLVEQSTRNLEAYELYLKGRQYWHQRTPASLKSSIECFERAIALDPDYALAHTGIADSLSILRVYGFVPAEGNRERAAEAVRRALEFGGNLWETHYSLGLFTMYYDVEIWPECVDHFSRAVEINPRAAVAHGYLSIMLSCLRRNDEARHHARLTAELDPLSPYAQSLAALALVMLDDQAEALAVAARALELQPDHPLGLWSVCVVHSRRGAHTEAVDALERLAVSTRSTPFWTGMRGRVLAHAGRTEEAADLLADLEQRSASEYVMPTFRAVIALALDQQDRFLTLIRASIAESAPPYALLAMLGPEIRDYDGDERYREVFAAMRIPGWV